MNGRGRGFKVADVLALLVFLILLGALLMSGPERPRDPHLVDCLSNVKNLVGLLGVVGRGSAYAEHSGADLVLSLVVRGDLRGPDGLSLLFCPGDDREGFPGEAAYRDLNLEARGTHGDLTSYAGRDPRDSRCHARWDAQPPVVLMCDDSDDHHDGRGFVVGLTGGAVRWRAKVDDWGLDPETKVVVGEGSPIEELRCLRAD